MKRILLPLLFIVLLSLSTLFNVIYLQHFTDGLISGLEQAQSLAEQGNAKQAYQHSVQTQSAFHEKSFLLHVTLFHSSIDEIELSFGEVLAFLAHGDTSSSYFAANAKLIAQLRLLSEGEQLTWKNIF